MAGTQQCSPWNVSKCLICLKDISLSCCSVGGGHDDSLRILHQLANVLQVSPTIYDQTDLEHLPKHLLCFSCNLRVSDAVKLRQEFLLIVNRLKVLTDLIKKDFVQSCQQNEGNVNSGKDEPGKKELKEVQRIRKAYGQCWTKCEVRVERCAGEQSLLEKDVSEEEVLSCDLFPSIPRLHFDLPNLQFGEWEGYHEGIVDYRTLLDSGDECEEIEGMIQRKDGSRDMCKEIVVMSSDLSLSQSALENVKLGVLLCHLCGEVYTGRKELEEHMIRAHTLLDSSYDGRGIEDVAKLIPFDTVSSFQGLFFVPQVATKAELKEYHYQTKLIEPKKSSGQTGARVKDSGRKRRAFEFVKSKSVKGKERDISFENPCSKISNRLEINQKQLVVYKRGRRGSRDSMESKTLAGEEGMNTLDRMVCDRESPSKIPPSHRPAVCKMCGKQVSRKSDMKRHMKTVHCVR